MISSATGPQNSVSNLTSAPIFDFRVPFSTIELRVVCSSTINSGDLSWILLTIHEYIDERLIRKGDGPLAPKQDPFGLQSDPPRISFVAQSVPGRLMTWSVLQIAAEGLYLSLPQVHKNYRANFEIWDYQDNFQWGFGKISTGRLPPPGIQLPTIIAIGNDTGPAKMMEITASEVVPAA